MLRCAIFIFALLSYSFTKAADTVITAKGGKIKSSGSSFSLKVGKLKNSSTSSKFGIEAINIKIASKNDSKISVSLLAPDGSTTVMLAQNNGGRGAGYDSTFFSDTAATTVEDGSAPFRGYYRPIQSLKTVNAGQATAGVWQLVIDDGNSTDTLVNWSIKFGTHPASGIHLDSSSLPILILNTKGKTIPGGTTNLSGHFYMIYGGAGRWNRMKDSMKYASYAGLHLHGSSSRGVPKLSYAVTMQDSVGNNHDTAMLGMPKEHDWDLIANYYDLTLLHNMLSQHFFTEMGHYSPRYKVVELVLNGVYEGLYLFIEKIKQGQGRVNVAKMTPSDTADDAVTGGYIVKTDKSGHFGWYSKISTSIYDDQYYLYDYPYPLDTQQKYYIHMYFDSFEAALYNGKMAAYPGNWRRYADPKSIIDYMLIQEMSKNGDGYASSFYMYKDRNSRDRHIHTGPVWDFDIAWDLGWMVDYTQWWYPHGSYFWWSKLFGGNGYGKGDSDLKNQLKCTWTVYRRGILATSAINHFIDSSVTAIAPGRERNFFQWPELTWTYQKGVDTNKYWIAQRLKWMDKNMLGTCRQDIDAPVAALKWKDTVLLEVNTHYTDSGITYHDNFGDSNVIVNSGNNIDTSKLGTYLVSYILLDKAGNKATLHRVVRVIDTIRPIIYFRNGDTAVAQIYEVYDDTDVVIKDNYDKHPLIKRAWSYAFSNNTPDSLGYFTVWYKATDQSGNVDSMKRIVHVLDLARPVIVYNGGDTLKVEVFNSYSDTDVHATDKYDAKPTLKRLTFLPANFTDKLGYTSVWYQATNRFGLTDSSFRVVTVIDSIPPTLSLKGSSNIFLHKDSIYYDSGYVANDNYDKHLRIDTSGTFKGTTDTGIFRVSYQATDQSGNKSTIVSRIITVGASTGINGIRNFSEDISIYPNPGDGEFTVNLKGMEDAEVFIRLYNALGSEILSAHARACSNCSFKINMAGRQEGVYIVRLQNYAGKGVAKLILVKQ